MWYIILFLLAIIVLLLFVISKLAHKVKNLIFEKNLLGQIITKD